MVVVCYNQWTSGIPIKKSTVRPRLLDRRGPFPYLGSLDSRGARAASAPAQAAMKHVPQEDRRGCGTPPTGAGAARIRRPGAPLLRFLDALPFLVAAFDAKGRVVFWNREAERVCGYSAERVVRCDPGAGSPSFDQGFRLPVLALLAHRKNDFREERLGIVTRTGRRKTLLVSGVSRACGIPGWPFLVLGLDISRLLEEDAGNRQALARIRQVLGQIPAPPQPADPRPGGRRLEELGLSRKEQEVARLLADGKSNKEIAARLSVTESTVKVHAHAVYRKLGVTGKVDLIRFVVRNEIPL